MVPGYPTFASIIDNISPSGARRNWLIEDYSRILVPSRDDTIVVERQAFSSIK